MQKTITSLLFLLSLIFVGTNSNAQKILLDSFFKNLEPRNIGPAGMSGRVTSIDAVWSNPNIIYLGTASGGVWKTENGGASWNAMFDKQPLQNIGAVAITQNNPSVVWVGTGEGNPRNSVNIGEGIYKSLDGGRNWKKMGLEKTRNIHRIIIDPNNPNIVYVGAIGNPYGAHAERGLFKTTDGGDTWQHILKTNDSSGVADMIMDPSNPNKLLVAMWQHRRTPYSFTSGGRGSGLYVTYDAGKNFKKLGKEEGLPEGDLGRIGLAISRSMPNRIYAMVEATKNGLYKTDDGGFNWELVNSDPQWVTNRPFYFQDIAVDPQNENRVYNIYQMISQSEDGGKTFKTIIPYRGIHPDHHAWWIHPTDGNFIIDGNDGGIGISRDRGKTWQFDDKIPAGQFYHINVDNEMPYHVMGGMQDNGSWRGPAYSFTYGGIRNYYWENIWGGDGFDVMPDPDDANWVYAMSQGGNVGRHHVKTGEDWDIQPPNLTPEKKMRFNWNGPIAQDPFDKSTIYFGSQYVHVSTNKGVSWKIISPDLTTNDTALQKQDVNGGLTIDITNAENYTTILCIEPSKFEKNVLWVGTDDGNIQLTKDGGKTWTNFRGKIPGMPMGAWVPQIKTSKYNAGEAFVVCNNYRQGDFTPYIFQTKDYGKTWKRIMNDKQVTGYALCFMQDTEEPNLFFAGTEQGLWMSFDAGNNWQQFKNNFPSVSTYDLAIQEREADLAIATFGRAIWILDDIRPLRLLASGKNILNKNLIAIQPPTAIQAIYKKAPGYDWSSWGLYEGDNRKRGAMLSFIYNKTIADTSKNSKPDSIWVKIYNDQNDLVRSFKTQADSGFNRFYWNFESKGIRQPGTSKPKPNTPEPVGIKVEPGTYKIIYQTSKDKDSTMLEVKEDPQVKISATVRAAQKTILERLNGLTNRLTGMTDTLSEAEDAIKKVEILIKDVEGKQADSLRKMGKVMQDSIKAVREGILGKKQEKQGYGTAYQVYAVSLLNDARGLITGKNTIPGEQEIQMVILAENAVDKAGQRLSNFIKGKWSEYQMAVEQMPIKIFK